MNSDLLQTLTAILAIVFSVISLTVTVISVIWTVKQVKSSTYERIRGRLFELNKIEVEHPDIFQSLNNEISEDWLKQGGRGHYLFMFFSFYEEIFVQRQKFRLIGEDEYQVWKNRLLNNLLTRKAVRSYWDKYYSKEARPDFQTYIAELIKHSP